MTAAATLIADAKGYAATSLTNAQTAIDAATNAITSIGHTTFYYNEPSPPDSPNFPKSLPVPDFSDVRPDPATPPSPVTPSPISSLDLAGAPTFAETAPSFVLPSTPSQIAEFQERVQPIDLTSNFPSAPELIVPLAIEVADRIEPDAPTVSIPTFDVLAPEALQNAPSDLAQTFHSGYRAAAPEFITMINSYVDDELLKINPEYHSQLARIETQLSSYLDGGTGLSPAVEDAIYSRARSKNNAEALRVRDQSLADAATRGFTMPTGALLSATQQARQAGADNNAAGAREIVVMQAEMEQKNLQFAVTTSASLRTAAVQAVMGYMQNLGQINAQALDYAKSVLNATVETYNAAVRAFTARVDMYKAEASVFSAKMQGALVEVEIYKAEVNALQALTQVDQAKVNVYRARIDSLNAVVGMYRTQVEAAVSKSSLEKLKIELFQAQVQAYGAQVQAKNAEWQGYTSAISGQTSRVQAYAARAQAFSHQVDAYRAQVQAQTEVVKAQGATNEAQLRGYAEQVRGYAAVVQANGDVARTKVESQKTQVLASQAYNQAAAAVAQMQTELYKAQRQMGIESGRLSMESMRASAANNLAYGEALAKVSVASAGISGNLAGAALAGMNALAVESATA